MSEPSTPVPQDALLQMLRETILAEVRADRTDLSLRQLAVVLTVHLTDEPQTVRGLAEQLQIPTPSTTRALDRLGELDLVCRQQDPRDGRSVIAQRTPSGAAMVKRLKGAMAVETEVRLRKAGA
jgi:DNA-binding MarR family transcriptional regulator